MNLQNASVSEHALITQLFDTQTHSVVWFIPKFTENNKATPVDFEVGYCNTAASLILDTPKHQIIGALLKSSDLMDQSFANIIPLLNMNSSTPSPSERAGVRQKSRLIHIK